jgi:DNA-binding transcriptional ArsR family regulator
VLAVAATNKLAGDPPWLMVISGSGNAKTETVNSVSEVERTIAISTIASEGALLSAVSKKNKQATGGLLRQLGDTGILVIKDFTSIVSGDRKARQQILAALREVHDGRWERTVGISGGLTITWKGRIIVIAACTTTWDSAYSVLAAMGPRFVTIRSSARTGRSNAGKRAIRNAGTESTIRDEISQAVAILIADAQLSPDNAKLTEDEEDDLVAAADLVTRARTGVELDYQSNVIDSHEPEMPTRFAKQLVLIFRGAMAIGIDRGPAMALALRCARDSIPPIRLIVLNDLAANDIEDCRVIDIATRLRKPWSTIRRTLDALYVLELVNGIVEADDANGNEDDDTKTTTSGDRKTMRYALAADVDLSVLDPT